MRLMTKRVEVKWRDDAHEFWSIDTQPIEQHKMVRQALKIAFYQLMLLVKLMDFGQNRVDRVDLMLSGNPLDPLPSRGFYHPSTCLARH